MSALRLLLFSALLLLIGRVPSLAADDSAWLPLSKSQLMELIGSELKSPQLTANPLDVLTVQGPRAAEIASIRAQIIELQDYLAPDNTIWMVNGLPVELLVTMAGRDDNVHTVRIMVPVVNYGEADSALVFNFLSALFKAIYPLEKDAADWPKDQLNDAWNRSPLVTNVDPKDPNDQIARESINGITSATIGVPPDIVVYTITTRNKCIPDLKRGNPFQRVIC